MRIIILSVLILIDLGTLANKYVDSLEQRLAVCENTTAELWLLTRLSYEYRGIDLEHSMLLARKEVKLARSLELVSEQALGFGNIGVVFSRQAQFDSALFYHLKAVKIMENEPDKEVMGTVFMDLANVYAYLGHYSLALKYYYRALEAANTYDRKSSVASITGNIGIMYLNMGDTMNSAKKIEEAYQLSLAIEEFLSAGNNAFNLAEIYSTNGKPEKGAKFLSLAENCFLNIDYKDGLALCKLRSAEIKMENKHYEEALVDFEETLAIFNHIGDKRSAFYCLEDLGDCHAALGNKKQAKEYYTRVINYMVESEDFSEMRQLIPVIIAQYKKWGDFEKAFEYSELLIKADHSHFTNEMQKEITEMNAKYESEKKEQLITGLQDEQRRKDVEAKIEHTALIAFVVISLLVTVFLVLSAIAYKRLRSKNQTIEEQKSKIEGSLKEKEVMLKEIHHRVKNNFQLMSSLLNLQASGDVDEVVKNAITESMNRINSMASIHQKLYENQNLAEVNMQEYLTGLLDTIQNSYNVGGKEISVTVNAQQIIMEADTGIAVGLIVNELVTNSYKYAFNGHSNAEISVELTNGSDRMKLKVADNGKGLPVDFQLEQTDSLGLVLVSLLSEQLEGTVSHRNDVGAVFEIDFPS